MRLKALMLTGGVLGFCSMTCPSAAVAQSMLPNATSPLVTTSGRGESHIAADRASVTIAVESRAASASGAAAANATATTSVLAALRGSGLSNSDLSTTGFTVSTDFMRMQMSMAGSPSSGGAVTQPAISFIARNGVRADIRALTNLSKVIDAALAAGATSIGQVQFTSSRIEEIRRDALTQAVERAHADAETIARAAGGTLGSLIEVTTLGGGLGTTYYELASAPNIGSGSLVRTQIRATPAPPTPLASGDVPVVVAVTARWQFVPGH
ncbi:MAG: SIMPL domain-containing protein [Gemmatimonadaceae bacterium]